MQGSEPEDVFRELRLLENEEPEKSFMILARRVEDVDKMNRWVCDIKNLTLISVNFQKFDNSSEATVLKAQDVPLVRLGSGFPLRMEKREDVKVVVGGKVMITHNLKAEKLANGIMARLVRVTREHLVLKR
ncbi:hypothetical protein PAEPH01_2476 [Pancytospora epiphaga]|nr:hypothetical protein PAEPH01_2476 [Pancytospora epiphaga]